MPKPSTKIELLEASSNGFKLLIQFVEGIGDGAKTQTFTKEGLNKNIRDVFAHLYHWHLLFLGWYEDGMNEKKPVMPSAGYTWKTVPDLNKKIWSMYQNITLKEIQKKLTQSHKKIHRIIELHSDEELFVKKYYPWTGSTSLGAYLISNSSSHYTWAIRLIKKNII